MSSRRARLVLGALLVGGLLWVQASGYAKPSAKKSEPNFQLLVPERVQLVVGQLAELSMRLQPSEGYRVSDKGPLRIDLRPAPESGLKAKKRRLSLRDATNPSSRAPVFLGQVSATNAGRYALPVSLDFWLCRGKLCRPEHAQLSIQLDVSDPAPPGLPDGGTPSDARTAPN